MEPVGRIDDDYSRADVMEACEQVNQGGLDGPFRTDLGNYLHQLRFQRLVFDDRLVWEVAKRDRFQADMAARASVGQGIRAVFQFSFGVEDFECAPGSGQCPLYAVVHVSQLANRSDETLPIANEGGNQTHGRRALQYKSTTKSGERNDEGIAKDIRQGHEQQGVGVGGGPRLTDHFIAAIGSGGHTLAPVEDGNWDKDKIELTSRL